MDELDGLMARCLRTALEADAIRREDFAQRMSNLGFRWTGNTVSQVLTGRRSMSLLEIAGVCALMQTSVSDLIARESQEIALPNGGRVDAADVAQALQQGRSVWSTAAEARAEIRAGLSENLEASVKAAKRLGVTPAEVDSASVELWGQVLAAERDRRVVATHDDTARGLQARRGHVTRGLIAELRSYFEQRGHQ